jgi:hypothetical protein
MHETRTRQGLARDEETVDGHVARRSSPRVDALLDGLDPTRPLWDLCCDGGQIGCVAMDRHPGATVVFVDKRPRLVAELASRLERTPRYHGRYRIERADILRLTLPSAPATVVLAGVGTNLILAFLARLEGRRGDRLVCSTSQCPDRFETLASAQGLVVLGRVQVRSRHGQQTIWRLAWHDEAPARGVPSV